MSLFAIILVTFSLCFLCTTALEQSSADKKYYYDCKEALLSGQSYSGIYSIKPDHLPPFNVYCDMDGDDGGWTVIQRRMDGSEDFNRKWKDYALGFGDLGGEFWLGLSKIHRITKAATRQDVNITLRVDFQDFGGELNTAEYQSFEVFDFLSGYRLSFGEINGNHSNSLSYDRNDMMFSTDDVDNDLDSRFNCAKKYYAGWWYNRCLPSKFNAPYISTPGDDKEKDYFSYEFSEMKLRRVKEIIHTDCKEAFNNGYRESGIFTINPDNQTPFKVYCDMETDGGGWIVFQRRQDGSEDFYRGWDDYEVGFGDLNGEFWLGLDKLHRIAPSGQTNTLRFDLSDFEGNNRYAKYSTFSVLDSSTKYRMNVAGYSGDATDSFTRHNGMKFSTKDSDNDVYSGDCANRFKGGWWYDACHEANLNGLYASTDYGEGVNWRHWKGYYYSLKITEMKLRN